MQEVVVAYTDHAPANSKSLPMAFPSLGKGLFKGDSGNKQDSWHVLQRVRDTFSSSNHALAQEAVEDLMNRMRLQHDGDLAKFLSSPVSSANKAAMPWVRDLLPPPHFMKKAIVDWAGHWLVQGVDAQGEMLFTLKTLLLVQRLQKSATNWELSGERVCAHRKE
jgi:hypothetical protein